MIIVTYNIRPQETAFNDLLIEREQLPNILEVTREGGCHSRKHRAIRELNAGIQRSNHTRRQEERAGIRRDD